MLLRDQEGPTGIYSPCPCPFSGSFQDIAGLTLTCKGPRKSACGITGLESHSSPLPRNGKPDTGLKLPRSLQFESGCCCFINGQTTASFRQASHIPDCSEVLIMGFNQSSRPLLTFFFNQPGWTRVTLTCGRSHLSNNSLHFLR